MLFQAVNKLKDEIAGLSEEECGDAVVLPLYAALPPDQQVTSIAYTHHQHALLCHRSQYTQYIEALAGAAQSLHYHRAHDGITDATQIFSTCTTLLFPSPHKRLVVHCGTAQGAHSDLAGAR